MKDAVPPDLRVFPGCSSGSAWDPPEDLCALPPVHYPRVARLINSRLAVAAAIVLLAVSGCAPTSGDRVRAADFGTAWPFTFEAGTLRCTRDRDRPMVTIEVESVAYGLNGAARGVGGFPDGFSVAKPGATGVDFQPFIDRGLKLCAGGE